MSTPILVLIIETILILSIIVIFLVFFRWQRKNTKTKALEELLDNIENQEDKRKHHIINHLQKSYALGDDKAKDLSEKIINAEKLFVQEFIQQQIQQTSISDFYDTLCGLLDQYLEHIPTLNSPDLYVTKNTVAPDNTEEQKNTIQDTKEIDQNQSHVSTENNSNDSELSNKTPTIEEAEPDWDDAFSETEDEIGEEIPENIKVEQNTEISSDEPDNTDPDLNWEDAFSESGDEMDESTKEAFTTETISEEDDTEVDWGDAFSESGDTMDEATKQGFEEGQKKE